MNKAELAAVVAERADVSETFARKFLTDVFEVIAEELDKGEEIGITAVGTLRAVDRPERVRRNPYTGGKVTVAPHRTAQLKVYRSLKTRLNAGK